MIKKIFYIGAIAALACGGCYLFNRSRKEREIEPIASREAKEEDRIPKEEVEKVVNYLESYPDYNKEYVKRISLVGMNSDYRGEIFGKLSIKERLLINKEGILAETSKDIKEAGKNLHHVGNTLDEMLGRNAIYRQLKNAGKGFCENIHERIYSREN